MLKPATHIVVVALLALISVTSPARASEDTLKILSLAWHGQFAGDGPSLAADVSGDGRFVVFESNATDLIFTDVAEIDSDREVYLWDGDREVTTLLVPISSTNPGPAEEDPAISDNGEYVVLNSEANGTLQTFIYERRTGVFELVSAVDGMRGPGNGEACARADVSDDGDRILFCSTSNDLVIDDANDASGPQPRQMFVRIRSEVRTIRVTEPESGTTPNDNSWDGTMSADGNTVAFVSEATNLPRADADGKLDIFLWNFSTRKIIDHLDVDLFVTPSPPNAYAEISSDGRVVAFTTPLSLVPEDDDTLRDAYVYENGVYEWVSPMPSSNINRPSLSADGRKVVYPANQYYVWLYDRDTGESRIVSKDVDGVERPAFRPQISADGGTVVFDTDFGLLPDLDDFDAHEDVFACDVTGSSASSRGRP